MTRSVKLRRLTGIAAFVVCVSALAGCGQSSTELTTFRAAAENASMDDPAERLCRTTIQSPPLVAALNSSSDEVRSIGARVTTQGAWDRDLPAVNEYVAICIVDVSGLDGLIDDPSFAAVWLTEQASETLTAW